jgi:hypothetical protein
VNARQIVATALALAPARQAHAQSCCGRVDLPVTSTERPGARRGALVLGLDYEYTFMDDGLVVSGYGMASGHSHTATLDASYGATSWLTPGVIVPFTYKRFDALIDGRDETRSTGGLGDAALLLKFGVLGRLALAPGALRAWLLAGVKFPTGDFEDRDGFGQLPASAQAGTGAWDAVGGATASIGLAGPGSRLVLVAAAL